MKTKIKIVFMALCMMLFILMAYAIQRFDKKIKEARIKKPDLGFGYQKDELTP